LGGGAHGWSELEEDLYRGLCFWFLALGSRLNFALPRHLHVSRREVRRRLVGVRTAGPPARYVRTAPLRVLMGVPHRARRAPGDRCGCGCCWLTEWPALTAPLQSPPPLLVSRARSPRA
jgi:hypothetical protein